MALQSPMEHHCSAVEWELSRLPFQTNPTLINVLSVLILGMTKVTSLNVQVTRTEMKFDVKSKIEITIHLYIFSNQPLIINYKYIIYDYIKYNLKEA